MKEYALAKIFKALGNETRLAIFNYVRSQEYDCRSNGNDQCCVNTEDRTVCVSHISKKFQHIGQAAISQHLKLLHESGLLRRHKIGSWVYYTIALIPLRELEEYFAHSSTMAQQTLRHAPE
jgi:DNA-binding transcriptional ArsR family regulator